MHIVQLDGLYTYASLYMQICTKAVTIYLYMQEWNPGYIGFDQEFQSPPPLPSLPMSNFI